MKGACWAAELNSVDLITWPAGLVWAGYVVGTAGLIGACTSLGFIWAGLTSKAGLTTGTCWANLGWSDNRACWANLTTRSAELDWAGGTGLD